ncbi:iron uptake porin [Chamaesiphon sp. OTE_8_metabat_110]|uniref:iron uptake porin n=1 Tax=Chamaesiphon sp. OTE_8_metabat_110 TaxID=2964696 RepID=UPI00286B8080|nr:iron uptake porin [Chamaesiphon sp. OTE_8_metabat_110]
MSNRPLNWLSITAGSLFATLLLITGAQAAEAGLSTSNSPNSTLLAHHTLSHRSTELIALRKKKRSKLKIKRKAKLTAIAAPTATSPTDLAQATPPPAPTELAPPPATPPAAEPTPTPNAPKVETPAPNHFSLNTKLEGQVIFGGAGVFSGDFERNAAFGHRTRLELITDINGGTLTTRLQAVGLGLSNQRDTEANPGAFTTNEGNLSYTDGTTGSSIGIDTLKYEFALTPQTQVVIAANAGASDDFTDTINPYFDGDGASGSISAFGNRPSIYYTVGGVGVGIRHKFSDSTELSLGYLANDGQTPAPGSGLFGGGYGAIAQLTFKTGENSKVGVTYTRTMNAEFGTGSNNANVNASGLSGMSNNFGLQGSFQLSPEFALGGWAGYTQNQAAGGDRQIWNWAITAAAPDLGGKGNLAGFLIGQEPRVASSSDGTTDTKAGLHIEGFYQFKVSDSLSITPGLIYLTAPNQEDGRGSALIGALRTTFTF